MIRTVLHSRRVLWTRILQRYLSAVRFVSQNEREGRVSGCIDSMTGGFDQMPECEHGKAELTPPLIADDSPRCFTHITRLLATIFLLPFVSGCFSYSLNTPDPTPYLAMEQGDLKRLYAVNIVSFLEFPPLPVTAKFNPRLVEKIPNPHNPFALAALVDRSPPWRDLDQYDTDLWKVVDVATGPERAQATYWIISTSPVIVAVGPEQRLDARYEFPRFESDGKIRLGSRIRLVSEADLDSPVDRIVIVGPWPRQIPADFPANHFQAKDLPAGAALRGLINSRQIE